MNPVQSWVQGTGLMLDWMVKTKILCLYNEQKLGIDLREMDVIEVWKGEV